MKKRVLSFMLLVALLVPLAMNAQDVALRKKNHVITPELEVKSLNRAISSMNVQNGPVQYSNLQSRNLNPMSSSNAMNGRGTRDVQYEKVTEELDDWSGNYIIGTNAGANVYAFDGTVNDAVSVYGYNTGGWTSVPQTASSSGVISDAGDAAILTLTAYEEDDEPTGWYFITVNDEYFLGSDSISGFKSTSDSESLTLDYLWYVYWYSNSSVPILYSYTDGSECYGIVFFIETEEGGDQYGGICNYALSYEGSTFGYYYTGLYRDTSGDNPIPVQSITASNLTLMEGCSAKIEYTLNPTDANSSLIFTSANTDVATVSARGIVTAVAAGTTTITITADDENAASTTITVTVEPLPVGLTFNFETDPAEDGWTFVDSDGDGYNWAWTNANSSAFEGTGTLYSESYHNNESGSGGTALTPDNWAITPAILIQNSSSTMNIVAWGRDASYAAEHFQFYVGTTADISSMTAVSSEFVATDSYALYTANLSAYAGQVVYLAIRHYNVTDEFILDVDYMVVTNAVLAPEGTPVTSITADDVTVMVGQTATITPTVLPEDATDPSVTYTSEDPTIATVDENGVVTGVAVGTTTIAIVSVSNPDVKANITVTVTAAPDPVQFTVVAPATAHPGDVITVEAYLNAPETGYTGFTGLVLGIHFDTDAFAVNGNPVAGPVTTASMTSLFALPNDNHPDEVQYSLVMTPGNPNTTTGLVFSMQFTVLTEVEPGSYTFYAEPTSAANFVYNPGSSATPIAYEYVPSTVEVTAAPTTLTQTIALVGGANWFSTGIDITLNDLKAALVAAAPGTTITIKAKGAQTSYNPNNGRWSGSITWNVNQMYIITVAQACELTLEGDPIVPAEHPITIKNGANWIGFPLTQSMTLTNAFDGFAINGDQVKSKGGTAQYNRGRWQGTTLTTLEPGKGYIYVSSEAEDRPLVFPAAE